MPFSTLIEKIVQRALVPGQLDVEGLELPFELGHPLGVPGKVELTCSTTAGPHRSAACSRYPPLPVASKAMPTTRGGRSQMKNMMSRCAS
ncbi:hypothetical protein P4050_30595 [Pseudomonas aeruginosa]|nr:hypothetical protein [Pseudomonas aeruginosa]